MKELYNENPDIVCGAMEELWQDEQKHKEQLARVWKRNADFANGLQTFDADSSYSKISGSSLIIGSDQDKRSKLFVTNEIEPVVRTMVSFLTRTKPVVRAYSADTTDTSKQASRLAEKVIEAKYDIDNEYEISRQSAYWSFICGTVFRKDYWDYSLGAQANIPKFDELGNELLDPQTGQPVMREQIIGDSNVAVLTGFTISFDWSATSLSMTDLPWIMESYMMPVEWAKDAFDQNAKGFTGKANEIDEDGKTGSVLNVLEELKYSTNRQGSYLLKKPKGKVLVRELYVRPNKEYPAGRLIIKAGSVVVFDSGANDNPYFFGGYKPIWHPYTDFSYSPFIGRLFGKSLVEGIVPLQLRLNEINGAIIENANTMAKPDWLAAEGQLKRGIINGAGGNIYTYKPIPSAGPPDRIQGVPLPAQFFNEKQSIIDQIVREVGTNFVMMGQPPSGVSAASAIEQLLENANTQHSDLINNWEKYHERGYVKKLNLIRKFNKFPNPELISNLKALVGKDALDLDVESFVGADLADGITLKIEAGSMVPKSEKLKREMLKEFAMSGLLGPIQEDSPRGAKLRKTLQTEFGLAKFESDESVDVQKQEWENERMKKGLPVEVWEKDNHDIHLSIIYDEMKRPTFLENVTDEVKMAFEQHAQGHEEVMFNMTQQAKASEEEQARMMMVADAKKEQAEKGLIPAEEIANIETMQGPELPPEQPAAFQ